MQRLTPDAANRLAGARARGRHRPGRPTLGVLVHGTGDPNSHMIWAGAASVAQEHDANLICFPAKPLRSPLGFEAQANVLYDLVNPGVLDALVSWVAGMTLWVDMAEARRVCESYRPLPIVTVGGLLPGFPGVAVDNYHGMFDVVAHMIEVHDYRRIAFVRGPENHQEAEERYRAYLDALAAYGVPFNPQLVALGNFKESGGVRAVETLLDRRQVDFDALVAASDNMAVGAIRTLQARGMRIPGDVAIAGLNDESQSPLVTPPLTTSPLHFYEQARQAAMMALALLEGRQVPEQVILPTHLLVRQSCGCPDPRVEEAAVRTATGSARSSRPATAELVAAVLAGLGVSTGPWSDRAEAVWAAQLLGAFQADLADEQPGGFLSTLAELMRQSAEAGEGISRWHGALSALRTALAAHLDGAARGRAEDLWQQARVLVGETARRAQAFQVLRVEEQSRRLADINQTLSAVIDQAELADVLAQALPELGITCCCLSLYEDPVAPTDRARLVMAYDESGRIALEPGGREFAAQALAPEGLLPAGHRYSLVAEPLYFREDQLGFVLFAAEPRQEELYEILRGQVSAAIKRAQLAARNVELYTEAVQARQVAEEGRRLAENANRLKSRFLATVSHELRTPLSLIVGTIEMMLHGETERQDALPAAYRRDLSSIRTSAQHLAHLIGDVLDLASSQAGELRLTCEPLNMGELMEKVALLGAPMAAEKGLSWRTEIGPCLPLVWGDRTRLQQVALNLVSNAIKFTERGEVVLSVHDGPGSVVVGVSDTGVGIPTDEQVAIFDEFRQSERTSGRGYGGMGIGLAISRQLIELHGGRIGVQSSGAEDSGSTFYFVLPAMHAAAAEPPARESLGQAVLLLSESGAANAQLREHLGARFFEVAELAIADHPDWLTQITANPPGAVLLNFEPAAERGWELMQHLKLNPNTRDVPVLFYSLSSDQDRGSLLALDYLAKPVASEEMARALERQGLGDGDRKRRKLVLLVDDDPCILDLHARVVQSHVPNVHILKARNGRHALAIMERERPDLVLLDLMMPEVDGFAVLERMRERELTREVPVIVLTAQILTGEDMTRLQHGVAAVLGKGLFSTSEVLEQVEAALAHNKRLGSEAQRVVRQVMVHIHEHYAEPITRQALASRFCLSERYLTRCFRQETGVTPVAYLNRYRVRQARLLLQRGDMSVTEVALACGFSDSNYFGRVFQQELGLTPSAYRRGERPPES